MGHKGGGAGCCCPKEVGSIIDEWCFQPDKLRLPQNSFSQCAVGGSVDEWFSLLMRKSWEGCQAHLPNPTLPKAAFPSMQIIQ